MSNRFLSLVTRDRRGFSLVELMVTITIISILSAIGYVSYSSAQVNARDSRRKQDLRSLQVAVELFNQTNKRFPCSGASWEVSGTTPPWISDVATTACLGTTTTSLSPNYINPIPTDPKSNSTSAPLATGTYGYGYYSVNAAFGSCAMGTYYIFVTQLENAADPDTLANKPKSVCGINLGSGSTPAFGNQSFVVAYP